MTRLLPNDADGDAMRRVIADGSDLSRPMIIDFHIAAPTEEVGQKIAAAARQAGFRTDLARDAVGEDWTCTCARAMLLEYESLIRAQEELANLVSPLGGRVDGWGTFGNV